MASHSVVPAVSADLSVTLTGSNDPVKPKASLVYTLTVKNLGLDTAQNLTMTDKLDTKTIFGSITAPRGWTCKYSAQSSTVTCTAPSLTSGSSAVVKITVTVSKTARVGKRLVNTGLVSSQTYDSQPTNNTATLQTMVTK